MAEESDFISITKVDPLDERELEALRGEIWAALKLLLDDPCVPAAFKSGFLEEDPALSSVIVNK